MKVSIVLPAYLEAENLKNILPAIKDEMQEIDYEILVIDTMECMDETKEICEKCNVKYISRRGGNNYGDAIRTGIEDARGTYIVIMDADGSHDPQCIPIFLDEMRDIKRKHIFTLCNVEETE